MSKYVTAQDIAKATTLVGLMKFNGKTFVNCWRNRIIRKYIKLKLGIEPEYIALRMIEAEIRRREIS